MARDAVSSGELARGQRAGEVVLEDTTMLYLTTLPFLLLLHTQLAKAFPVLPEHLEEKNLKLAEVNELSVVGDLLMTAEFRGVFPFLI